MKRLLILFFLALPLRAQTVANPSFEAAAAGWTVTGYAGTFQPSTAQFPSLPDGKTVAWSNGGSFSQDLGVAAQANVTYILSVFVGHRLDSHTSPYTISLNAGATALCTGTGSNGDFPAGTFKQISLTCPAGANPPTGNLSIALGATGTQVDFDNVTLTSQSVTSPQPDSITVKAQLLWCSICDHTDDVPATGNLVVAQTGGPSSTQNILSDGTVVMSGTIDVAQDPLEFTIYLTDENGASQPGANLTLRFPRFELDSLGFLFKTITLGIVRIAHTVQFNDTDCLAPIGCPAVRIVEGQLSIGK